MIKDPRRNVYATVNRVAHWAVASGLSKHVHAIEPVSDEDDYLHRALNAVEADALHRKAMELYEEHIQMLLTHGPQVAQGFAAAAIRTDPYVKVDATEFSDACTTFCVDGDHFHPKPKKED